MVVSNSVTSVTSLPAVLTVMIPQSFANLTNGLVLHLPFDGNFNDTSGKGHNGAGVGATPLSRANWARVSMSPTV